jgi:hypothetical protein
MVAVLPAGRESRGAVRVWVVSIKRARSPAVANEPVGNDPFGPGPTGEAESPSPDAE